MRIDGGCHCRNISFVLDWPGSDVELPVRSCSCGFCTMHGGTYTSHREATLRCVVNDPERVSRYRFGTRTADFYVCSTCGAVPFVTSVIEGHLYAVVNVNTFTDLDRSRCVDSITDFAGEAVEDRLQRRSRTWIPDVVVSDAHDA